MVLPANIDIETENLFEGVVICFTRSGILPDIKRIMGTGQHGSAEIGIQSTNLLQRAKKRWICVATAEIPLSMENHYSHQKTSRDG
jgi:hypothetical protein